MKRLVLAIVAVAVLAVGYFALRGQSFWTLGHDRVKPIPAGDQEIAWIAPATSSENWERLVKAVRLLSETWVQTHGGEPLLIDTDRAYLPLTADVPEIGLRFPNSGTLWIRWYKLSGVNDSAHWIAGFQRRGAPPLAIIGGDTSDRALRTAENLERVRTSWQGPAPLFLITTATAERYLPPGRPDLELDNSDWPRLMAVYPGRTFRFSFTNTRMVEAVLDFVGQRPQLWADRPKDADPKAAPFYLFTLTWLDDGYSKDLAYAFQKLYADSVRAKLGKDAIVPADEDFVHYSAGDYFQPNPREEMAVGLFLANSARRDQGPKLLVLPTGAQRARRLLRTLCRRAPGELRDLVVASGDSISFNSLYRDRDLAWNVQDVPVPLVVFSHRNPIDTASGFGAKEPGSGLVDTTSTQDLLLYRDIAEAVVLSAFPNEVLTSDADVMRERLRGLVWRKGRIVPSADAGTSFFDAEGNRTAGTGEHVVWLQPTFAGGRVLPHATLTVYRLKLDDGQSTWRDIGSLEVFYDHANEQAPTIEKRSP